ncbi:MAG: Uma2 family endonuclease [Symploca sp. SIO1C2]|nr:Uma2 family endonuclease [Symploca sp. SIO1C2]NER48959.1 Uma2 family endonuclease [Symploca sp. SIO1A3]
MSALTLNLPPILKLTDEQFTKLAVANQDLQLELTAKGELVIMPPTGGDTGNRNFEVYIDLGIWNRQTRLGKAFDSSTGFRLPLGSTRSPDASWVKIERWNALTQEQRKKFLPLCPDFALEIVSETDDVEETRTKMREYFDNGLRLGWLINPKLKQVEIYRPNREVELLQSPATLSGEEVLPGFVLDLQPIFA